MSSVELKVHELRVDEQSQGPVLVLKEVHGDRTLMMSMGPQEAITVLDLLERMETRRPSTHDLLQHVIDALNGRLLRVEITDLREDTFVSVLCVEQGNRLITVDARPSDAIALAVRCGAPIVVRESVLKRANRDPSETPNDALLPVHLRDAEVEQLRMWLENLPDDHFGKYKM